MSTRLDAGRGEPSAAWDALFPRDDAPKVFDAHAINRGAPETTAHKARTMEDADVSFGHFRTSARVIGRSVSPR
jgi:hypothetical protein